MEDEKFNFLTKRSVFWKYVINNGTIQVCEFAINHPKFDKNEFFLSTHMTSMVTNLLMNNQPEKVELLFSTNHQILHDICYEDIVDLDDDALRQFHILDSIHRTPSIMSKLNNQFYETVFVQNFNDECLAVVKKLLQMYTYSPQFLRDIVKKRMYCGNQNIVTAAMSSEQFDVDQNFDLVKYAFENGLFRVVVGLLSKPKKLENVSKIIEWHNKMKVYYSSTVIALLSNCSNNPATNHYSTISQHQKYSKMFRY
jgi:hypothetical protein